MYADSSYVAENKKERTSSFFLRLKLCDFVCCIAAVRCVWVIVAVGALYELSADECASADPSVCVIVDDVDVRANFQLQLRMCHTLFSVDFFLPTALMDRAQVTNAFAVVVLDFLPLQWWFLHVFNAGSYHGAVETKQEDHYKNLCSRDSSAYSR